MKLHSETYDSYKKSEGEWSDTTPSEWQEKRVKDLFRLVTDAAPADNDYELLSLYAGIGVKPRKDMEARGNKASSTDGYWIVKKNDIVVNKLLAWMGSVGLSEYDGVTSPAYDVLRQVKSDIDPRYFSYLFRTETAKKIFRKNSRGIMDMRLRLYFDKLGSITVPSPTLLEQKKICNYIDSKISLLDRKIEILKNKIAAYEKLKIAVIRYAISRGLKDDREMKNSDVEWIGEIPRSWRVCRVKDISSSTNGGAFKDDICDKGLPIIKIQQLTNSSEVKEYCSPESKKIKRDNILSDGDLVFSWSTLIYPFIYRGPKALLNQHIFKVTHKHDIDRYWMYYMLMYSSERLKTFAHGSTMQHILKSDFDNLEVGLPPYSEQVEIGRYLKEKVGNIENIKGNLDEQIARIKELKIAIINDAILGFIRVTEVSSKKGWV